MWKKKYFYDIFLGLTTALFSKVGDRSWVTDLGEFCSFRLYWDGIDSNRRFRRAFYFFLLGSAVWFGLGYLMLGGRVDWKTL